MKFPPYNVMIRRCTHTRLVRKNLGIVIWCSWCGAFKWNQPGHEWITPKRTRRP